MPSLCVPVHNLYETLIYGFVLFCFSVLTLVIRSILLSIVLAGTALKSSPHRNHECKINDFIPKQSLFFNHYVRSSFLDIVFII